MAKLTQFEKTMYANNMEIARDNNITFAQNESKCLTVAVMPNDKMQGFIRVYVAYCGKETPKRKRGINAVMEHFFNDNYILVPCDFFGDRDEAFFMLGVIQDNYF